MCEDDGDGELELLDEPALVEGEADGGHVVDDDEAGQLQHRGPEVGGLHLGLDQASYTVVVDETLINLTPTPVPNFDKISVEKSPVFKRACPFKRAFWENRPFFARFFWEFARFFVILSTFYVD